VLCALDERGEARSLVVVALAGLGHPLVTPAPDPHEPDGARRQQAGEEAGEHHFGLAWESNRGGHQHHRVDGRRRQQERDRGGGRDASGHEPSCDWHRAALAPGEGDAGDGSDRYGRRGTAGQYASQRRGRNERGDGAADRHAEHEERQRLDRDRHEDRRPMRDCGVVEQTREHRARQRRDHNDCGDYCDAGRLPVAAFTLSRRLGDGRGSGRVVVLLHRRRA
jgi:hypothetical protein